MSKKYWLREDEMDFLNYGPRPGWEHVSEEEVEKRIKKYAGEYPSQYAEFMDKLRAEGRAWLGMKGWERYQAQVERPESAWRGNPIRQHKSPYFYVRKGAGFVLLENHVETGTRYKTEAEAKRAVLALNDAWRAKGAKSNPRRRNPAPTRADIVDRADASIENGMGGVTLTTLEDILDGYDGDGIRAQFYVGWRDSDLRALMSELESRGVQRRNPRRRNPGAAGEAEMVLWARPAGQTDALYEQPIYTQGRTMEDIERVKKLAAKEGWHTFRVQRIDLSKPYNAQKEFAATIRGSRRRNPAGKYVEGRDAKGFRKLSDLKHGEYFKLKKDSRKVYRKGDYDRSERKYACEDEDDISNEILVLGDRLVYVGFMY